MENLPIEQKKLNIFQKLRLRFFLLRKYSYSEFDKAPEYIKQDDKILKKLIAEDLSSVAPNKNRLIDLFMKKPDLFDKESQKQILEYALDSRKYEVFSKLTNDEQYNFITTKVALKQKSDILKFANIDVIKRLLSNEFTLSYSWNFGENNGSGFYIKYVPDFLCFCDINTQMEIISQNKEWIQYASTDAQLVYLKQNENDIDFVNSDVRNAFLDKNIEFLNAHPSYIQKSSKETQLLFASQDRKNLKYINQEYQLELIEKHPLAIKYADEQIKWLLFNKPEAFTEKFKKSPFDLTNKILKADSKYFKFVGFDKNNNIAEEFIKSLNSNIDTLDNEKIIDYFIKSGLLSAKGNLRTHSSSFYAGDENVFALDIYSEEQINAIQQLDEKNICELIKIDANYILPYSKGKTHSQRYQIQEDEFEECEEKCKKILIELYGEEKSQNLEPCLKAIFNAQKEFQEGPGLKIENLTVRHDFRIPLESLKLLFNQDIVNTNSEQLITEYYSKLFGDEDEKSSFEQIIVNTYGNKAKDILDSRKELDVYAINSLEIFDSRIMDNFSEEFIHDLLSYNIRDFSAFLNIIKNKDEFVLFKEYYNILSNALGSNVETMQKAISEFYYNKELLKNLSSERLSKEQYINLISILCGEKNPLDIQNIEQLDNYDEIMYKDFEEKLHSELNLKDTILQNIFGINQSTLTNLLNLYDLDCHANKNILTDEEQELLQHLNTISKETNTKILTEMAHSLMLQKGIRNPIVLQTAIAKTKEHQIEILNKKLLSKSQLDESCEKNENGIRKENIDGVEIYYFEGFQSNLGFITHVDSYAEGRDFMENEGQEGMSTVSTRFEDINSISSYLFDPPHYLFDYVESEDLLAYNNSDANTSHVPKLVKSSARTNKIKSVTNSSGNEIAFYRRRRNHDKRQNMGKDGRIKPSFICIINHKQTFGSVNDIPESDLEYAKKYNIPIIVFKSEAYRGKLYPESRKNDEIEK